MQPCHNSTEAGGAAAAVPCSGPKGVSGELAHSRDIEMKSEFKTSLRLKQRNVRQAPLRGQDWKWPDNGLGRKIHGCSK